MTKSRIRAPERARTPRIIQITGLNYPDSAPVLAALDDQGRIWAADLSEVFHRPDWRELYPIQADEPIKEPAKTALVDQTEKAGLLRELDSLLYHAGRDLHFLAAEIEAAVDRLGGEGLTDRALVAADLIRLAGKVVRQASADLVEGGAA